VYGVLIVRSSQRGNYCFCYDGDSSNNNHNNNNNNNHYALDTADYWPHISHKNHEPKCLQRFDSMLMLWPWHGYGKCKKYGPHASLINSISCKCCFKYKISRTHWNGNNDCFVRNRKMSIVDCLKILCRLSITLRKTTKMSWVIVMQRWFERNSSGYESRKLPPNQRVRMCVCTNWHNNQSTYRLISLLMYIFIQL
jgi:hypothetical protein